GRRRPPEAAPGLLVLRPAGERLAELVVRLAIAAERLERAGGDGRRLVEGRALLEHAAGERQPSVGAAAHVLDPREPELRVDVPRARRERRLELARRGLDLAAATKQGAAHLADLRVLRRELGGLREVGLGGVEPA